MSGHVRALAVVTVTVGAALLPFAGKAFNVDDPLFLWVARRILEHPLDFYGFDLNWYGTVMRMSDVTKNPPLAAYYAALVAKGFGFREVPLHLAFLLWALACAWGTHALAGRLAPEGPLLATLAAIATPAFVVSSTSVMCDVMMLALWVWAVVLWHDGLVRRDVRRFAAAAVVVTACTLTKYYGAALLPLLGVYALARERRLGGWIVWLLVPLVPLAAYQWGTEALYGRGLLLDAAGYSVEARAVEETDRVRALLTGLSFTGGCVLLPLLLGPVLWSRRALVVGAVVVAAVAAAAAALGTIDLLDFRDPTAASWLAGVWWSAALWYGVLAVGGVATIALAAAELARTRDATALLLALWVFGAFVFSTFLNWTINGRAVLAMVPAVGILLVRRLAARMPGGRWPRVLGGAVAATGVVALGLAWADTDWADTARRTARALCAEHAGSDRRLWFQGHWGFQWYMEACGAEAWAADAPADRPGDVLVIPILNCNQYEPSPRAYEFLGRREQPTARWLATFHPDLGANFYAHVLGPFPWVAGPPPSDDMLLFRRKGGA